MNTMPYGSKYKTAQEIWDAILKTFGGNEATKKTKKNLLKQQYGNFKSEGSETLEQTFIRLQIIVSQLEFMDIEIEQDVYESKVQRKLESNSQNMAFISSAKNSSRKEEVNTTSIPTASTNVSPASANIGADINRIDEDDIEVMDIRWNIALLSMRADRYWKRIGKKITIQGLPEAKTREGEATTDKGLRPSPTIESTSVDVQNRNPSVTETEISPSTILSKPFIRFMKAADRPTEDKTDKVKTTKKTTVKYAELYRKTFKKSNGSGPDISYSMHCHSQHMHAPLQSYMDLGLRVLRYLKGTPGSSINFEKSEHMSLKVYADSDWAKCPVTRRSVSGYCVVYNGCLVSWKSKKQATLLKSSAEAEYRSVAAATCELMWIVNILKDLKVTNLLPAELFCDNSASIQIAANHVMHEKTKHFDLDVHIIREKIA
nr:ribonuclease H-like domain-containing protein [Tanacetum cinerariifolium]